MAIHNLKIVVVNGGRSNNYKYKSGGNDAEDKKDNKDSPLYKLLHAKDSIKNKVQSGMSPATVFAMDMGIRVASQVVKQSANFYISDIGRKNGDSNYQALINRQLEVVSDTMSFASGALSGATAGSMFGPLGAGIGLVVGAASSAISLGFKYADRKRDYEHEMFKNNNSQAYNLARTSFQGFTGRLR